MSLRSPLAKHVQNPLKIVIANERERKQTNHMCNYLIS